jgi:hypothetical protein
MVLRGRGESGHGAKVESKALKKTVNRHVLVEVVLVRS